MVAVIKRAILPGQRLALSRHSLRRQIRTVDLEMTLGALGRPSPLKTVALGETKGLRILPGHIVACRHSGTSMVRALVITYLARVKVQLMTLQADKRLILLEQIVGYGPVGGVAYGAVFQHGCMFKDEGALFRRMTVQTEIV